MPASREHKNRASGAVGLAATGIAAGPTSAAALATAARQHTEPSCQASAWYHLYERAMFC